MKKILLCFVLVAVLSSTTPAVRAADLYANSLVAYSFADLVAPQNALGEPDQLYADFRDEETYLKLDMGEGEEGRDGLTLFYTLLNYGAIVIVTFYDADNVILGTDNTLFAPGVTEWTAEYVGLEPFRFVKIESTEIEQWKLDAVQAVAINTPVVVEQPVEVVPVEPTVVVDADEDALQSNQLIKLETSDAVYVVGDDGKRHPFPNETTFYSWGYSFDDVTTVVEEVMSDYLIGGSVTIKPGTYLVKLQSVPKVYVVAPGHTLRWLYTEAIATELYGESWANEVVDVSDAFWPDYVEGSLINSADDLAGWEVETQPF